MVFKALINSNSGILNNQADDFGYFSDTILVLDDNNYTIATFENADVIDTSRNPTGGSAVTHLIYAGSGNDTVIGGFAVQIVSDGSGNDQGNLGSDNDVLFVGSGNDTFNGGTGIDSLEFTYTTYDGLFAPSLNNAAVNVDLAKTGIQNLGVYGHDSFRNFENLVGGGGNDTLCGNGKANTLEGAGGNDRLEGRSGNDSILGGEGGDTCAGGAGADTLDLTETANARDTLVYSALTDSGLDGASRDRVIDFDDGASLTADRIDLSAIDAHLTKAGDQAFFFAGTAAFSRNGGEVRYEVSGSDVIVHIDIDADADSEMTILVEGVTSLTAGDFIL